MEESDPCIYVVGDLKTRTRIVAENDLQHASLVHARTVKEAVKVALQDRNWGVDYVQIWTDQGPLTPQRGMAGGWDAGEQEAAA